MQGEPLRGECLVELDQIDVIHPQTRARECLARGGNRTDAHDRRIDAGDSRGDDPRERLRVAGRLR
jgi:hypothetical protein